MESTPLPACRCRRMTTITRLPLLPHQRIRPRSSLCQLPRPLLSLRPRLPRRSLQSRRSTPRPELRHPNLYRNPRRLNLHRLHRILPQPLLRKHPSPSQFPHQRLRPEPPRPSRKHLQPSSLRLWSPRLRPATRHLQLFQQPPPLYQPARPPHLPPPLHQQQ
jgi:hypothetical protein